MFASCAQAAEPPRELATAGVSVAEWDQVQVEVKRQASRARVSEAALDAVAWRLGVALSKRGKVDISDILGQIETLAQKISELEVRLSAYRRDDDPAIVAAIDAARALINAGDLEGADSQLAEARRLREARNAVRAAERQAQEDQDRADDASVIASQAEVALLRYDHLRAAALYAEAAAAMPASDASGRWRYLISQADALRTRGAVFNESGPLRAAVSIYENEAGQLVNKSTHPGDWASMRNKLGIALADLGVRGDEVALVKGVKAFEDVLTVQTRDRDPAGWAKLQVNLGNLLEQISTKGDGATLAKAMKAYENALSVFTRERDPRDWATTQMNLGIAQESLFIRGENAALAKAIFAYENALTVFTRERDPENWARTQMNFGNALQALGDRGDDEALTRSVTAYQEALTVRTRERNPAGWALNMRNLGKAYFKRGQRGDRAAFPNAIKAYEAALTVFTQDHDPFRWAGTQGLLGDVFVALGAQGEGGALDSAVQAYLAALTVFKYDRFPKQWAEVQQSLGIALSRLGEWGDDEALAKGVQAFEKALLVQTRQHNPSAWANTQFNIGLTMDARGDLATSRGLRARTYYDQALLHFRAAAEVFTLKSAPELAKEIAANIANVERKRVASKSEHSG